MKYRSGRRNNRIKYINILLAFVAFGLFIYYWPQFRTVARPLIEPVMRGYGGTKGFLNFFPESFTTYFSSRNDLATRNADLEMEVERLENRLAERDALLRERALLAGVSAEPQLAPSIVMYPIAEDITKMYSTILLSKGYKDGVEKSALVYVRGLQPVCEIVEVYDKTSLCELYSKGNRITEGVTSSSSITLSLSGIGGGSFIAEAPKGALIAVGETVYLRSNQAFTLGTVVLIKEDEQSTGAKIYVRGAYNPVTSSLFYMNARYAP